jgi:hypothetical protein
LSACAPTTSTSTRRTASTPTSRSRRSSKRSGRSWPPARRATSGFSEWTVEQIQAAVEIVGAEFLVSSQPQYSMLLQAPETELFDACTPLAISHIV